MRRTRRRISNSLNTKPQTDRVTPRAAAVREKLRLGASGRWRSDAGWAACPPPCAALSCRGSSDWGALIARGRALCVAPFAAPRGAGRDRAPAGGEGVYGVWDVDLAILPFVLWGCQPVGVRGLGAAFVAQGGLDARGSPLGPAAHRRFGLGIEGVGDGLQGHAAGPHG